MAEHGGKRSGAGRKQGSKAINGEKLRSHFLELLEKNVDQLQKDLEALTPYQRWKIILGLMARVLPRQYELQNENNTPINFTFEIIGEAPKVDSN